MGLSPRLPQPAESAKPTAAERFSHPERLALELPRTQALALAGAVVFLALLTWLHLRANFNQTMAYWRARQSSVADDRAQRLEDWLLERQADAQLFSRRPSVRAALRAHFVPERSPRRLPGGPPDLTAVLDDMLRLYSYAGVYVLNPDLQVVAQSNRALALSPALAEVCRATARAGALRIDSLGDTPNTTLISFCTPVFPEPAAAQAGPSSGQPLGVTLLVVDAARTLFPLLTRQGVPTRTAETVLVRREGNDIVFFSPLRHAPAGTRNPRFSIPTAPQPARAALEGREISLEAADYRGVPVLTSTQRIPLTGWGLVRKIDRDEALADFYTGAWLEVLVALLLVVSAGILWRGHRRKTVMRFLQQEVARQQAVLALQAAVTDSERRLRELVESLDAIVWEADAHTLQFTFVSRRAEEILGYPIDQWLTARDFLLDHIYPEDREKASASFRAAARTEKDQTLTYRMLAADGHVVWLRNKCRGLRHADGSVPQLRGLMLDITERKRAEEAIRKNEAGLAEAQRTAHLGNWEWDIVNDRGWWSDEMYRIFGVNRESFVPTLEISLKCFHPDDRGRVQAALKEAFEAGNPYALDYRIVRPDGTVRIVHAQGEVFSDEARKPLRMVGIVQDVTEQKRAEEEIRKLNEELEARVAQRTEQLEASNKELEAFTYSVSHDLRAPLRHADGFSKLLVEEHKAELSSEAQEYVSMIRESVIQMGVLIDDLLNLTRVGKKELKVQVAGLNSLVKEAVDDLKRANPQRAIEWKIATLPFVECDPALLKQVFANLLSNAVKFTRPRNPGVIEVGAIQQDARPVVFVRDNGVGFSMKYSDKLFGVFQRLHRAEDFEGTGVGLATVQRIIHKHGGRVWAEGELDKGATFYFTLGSSDDFEPQAQPIQEVSRDR